LIQLEKENYLDVWFFDESGFNLTPNVPYAWQMKGDQLKIPASYSSRINVLGFMTKNNNFVFETYQGKVTSSVVIKAFEQFFNANHSKKTVIVIDNAPFHTSKLFKQKMKEWEEHDFYIFFLPPYSPELNLIEILWRKIKYEWLPFSAYKSLSHLDTALNHILINFGRHKKHEINFS